MSITGKKAVAADFHLVGAATSMWLLLAKLRDGPLALAGLGADPRNFDIHRVRGDGLG